MAKLNQLILLENMMRTYDHMNIKDANLTRFQGMCTEKLVDEIIGRLEKMVVSKTLLSCRNVLLANYETMTKPTYWLGCKLFSDLPRAASRALREKVERMVELLNELMLKIVNVDDEYAATFFKKLRTAYGKRRISKYELWKAQLPEVTMELLTEYQTELTADLLMMGVLKYDRQPSDGELEQVQLDKVQQNLRHGRALPEWFGAECAKLRRYSHWEGPMFMIDYEKLRKYMFQHFGELTQDQRIALFEYDVQLAMIHRDMKPSQKPTQQPTPDPSLKGREERLLPPELSSRRARRIFARAVEARLLTADYQRPSDAEWWKMACMADVIGEELSLSNKWVVFCSLWGNSNLRKYNTDKQGMTDYNNFRKILRSQIL